METFFILLMVAVLAFMVWRSHKQRQPPAVSVIRPTITVTFDSPAPPTEQDIDKDNWEGSFWEVEAPFPVKSTLLLSYVDGQGSATERTVDVRQAGAAPYGAMLIGRCHMRDATRTFRTDRIKHCVDAETGEVIDDVYKYLRSKYESSSDFTLDKLYNDEYDTLRVLLYVGKADGQLRAPERKVIAAACKVLTGDTRIDDEQVKALLGQMDVPTLQSFKVAVGNINKRRDESLKRKVLKAAEAIVATQKTVTATEQDALDYITKRFATSE